MGRERQHFKTLKDSHYSLMLFSTRTK